MNASTYTPNIEIENGIITINSEVRLDREAILLIDSLQTGLGDHYRNTLRLLSDILIENCEDMNIEYDEAIHLLQAIGQLRADLQTLTLPQNPQAGKTEFDMCLNDKQDADVDVIASMQLDDDNDNPGDSGDDEVPDSADDDSELQYAGK